MLLAEALRKMENLRVERSDDLKEREIIRNEHEAKLAQWETNASEELMQELDAQNARMREIDTGPLQQFKEAFVELIDSVKGFIVFCNKFGAGLYLCLLNVHTFWRNIDAFYNQVNGEPYALGNRDKYKTAIQQSGEGCVKAIKDIQNINNIGDPEKVLAELQKNDEFDYHLWNSKLGLYENLARNVIESMRVLYLYSNGDPQAIHEYESKLPSTVAVGGGVDQKGDSE